MKVLLINPPDTHSVNFALGKTNTPFLHVFTPPLGLLYIKSYLKEELPGSEIRLFNFQVTQKPTLSVFQNFLKEFQPDVIGITVMSFFWYDTCKTVEMIREVLPEALIVGGGVHMRYYPEACLEGGNFDIIVQGPGEKIFRDIINAHQNKNSFNTIKGIYFKKAGKISHTAPNDEIKDLNLIPFPDRSDININQHHSPENSYAETVIVLASTGCPFNCSYCDNRNRTYRARRPELVVKELLECKKMGYRAIMFSDEFFTCSRQYVINLCREMLNQNVDMPWRCSTRVDHIDEEMVRLMIQAGCERIQFGVESGSQHILDKINKKITLDQCRKAFKLCRELRLVTIGYFMIGFPEETKQMAEKTLSFAEELDPDYVMLMPVVPIPGSDLLHQMGNYHNYDSEWLIRYILHPQPNLNIKMLIDVYI